MKELKEYLPQEAGKHAIYIRLTDQEYAELRAAAKEMNTRHTSIVVGLMRRWLEERRERHEHGRDTTGC